MKILEKAEGRPVNDDMGFINKTEVACEYRPIELFWITRLVLKP